MPGILPLPTPGPDPRQQGRPSPTPENPAGSGPMPGAVNNIDPLWMQPWTGQAGMPTYSYGQGGGGGVGWGGVSAPRPYAGSFNFTPERFTAPTDVTMQNDPGYKFRMKMGTDALQGSAAARGTLLTGGTAKGLQQFGQDYASNEFQNVYNRALGAYGANTQNAYNAAALNQSGALQAYGIDAGHQMQAGMANAQGQMAAQQFNANTGMANAQFAYNAGMGAYDRTYNSYRTDQDNAFSRPFSLAQLGAQSAAGAAGMYGNAATGGANNMGNYWTQGANAQAGGQAASGSTWGNAAQRLGNLGSQAYLGYTQPSYSGYGR